MKRAAYLRNLSSDHHRALVLARRIARGDSVDQQLQEQVRALFHQELAPHFEAEEQALLPALERAGATELVKRTRDEHRQMRKLIAQLRLPGNLHAFGQLLKDHIRFEERVLFQAAQKLLPRPEIDQLAQFAVPSQDSSRANPNDF